jgi:hypothetical protein
MVAARCPQCGREYQFDDSRIGAQEVCTRCAATFVVAQSNPSAGQPGAATTQTQFAPPAGQAAPPYPPQPPTYYPVYYPPQPANSNAIAALVLGIASITIFLAGFILGPLAIYYSGKALREIGNANGGGRNFAVAGRITGIIGTIMSSFLILLYIIAIIFAFIILAHFSHTLPPDTLPSS